MIKYPVSIRFLMQFSRELSDSDKAKIQAEIKRFCSRLRAAGYEGSSYEVAEHHPVDTERLRVSRLILPGTPPAEA